MSIPFEEEFIYDEQVSFENPCDSEQFNNNSDGELVSNESQISYSSNEEEQSVDGSHGSWIIDLEGSLEDGCDSETIRDICCGRVLPDSCRVKSWKVCLNVIGKANMFDTWDGELDLKDQLMLHEDCVSLANKAQVHRSDLDIIEYVDNTEQIMTLYCKTRGIEYETSNFLLDILAVVLQLDMSIGDTYNCFYSLLLKFIPRDCNPNGKVYHLFRILILYHEPELCSLFDSKKVPVETFSDLWLKSIFASVCSADVLLKLWDIYIVQGNPFLGLFLGLVILANTKDQLLDMENLPRDEIIARVRDFPKALRGEDVFDFCTLACHFADKTPLSFKTDSFQSIFGSSIHALKDDFNLDKALCLPVSIREILASSKAECASFFVVDCRPPEQYNAGHLPTAFHLDASLMIQEPDEFHTAMAALFDAQQQSLQVHSEAAGENLCFLGSGRDNEDQYLNMVVANILQRHHKYVSIARGGYFTLHAISKETRFKV